MYKCRNFTISELVHPELLSKYGGTNCWRRLDERVLKDLDIIREEWEDKHPENPYIVINGEFAGSTFRHSGLRHWNQEYLPKGSEFSVHKMGGAFDLKPKNYKYEDLWRVVKELAESGILNGINTLEVFEKTPTWVHVAHMNHDEKMMVIWP